MTKPNPEFATVNLLEELNKTIKARGHDATVAVLINARNVISQSDTIQFTISAACIACGIHADQLFGLIEGNAEKIKYCKAFIIYYLRNDFNITWPQIKIVLNHKDQSWLWDLMNIIKTLKPKLSSDFGWVKIKYGLDNEIKKHKKTLKKN